MDGTGSPVFDGTRDLIEKAKETLLIAEDLKVQQKTEDYKEKLTELRQKATLARVEQFTDGLQLKETAQQLQSALDNLKSILSPPTARPTSPEGSPDDETSRIIEEANASRIKRTVKVKQKSTQESRESFAKSKWIGTLEAVISGDDIDEHLIEPLKVMIKDVLEKGYDEIGGLNHLMDFMFGKKPGEWGSFSPDIVGSTKITAIKDIVAQVDVNGEEGERLKLLLRMFNKAIQNANEINTPPEPAPELAPDPVPEPAPAPAATPQTGPFSGITGTARPGKTLLGRSAAKRNPPIVPAE